MPYNRFAKPRVKGVQIHRPFIYGSYAKPIDPAHRPPNTNADHTHQWTIYIRPLPGQDLTHWLKKVQFKLHETYANSSRMIESPPFEVTETGWGEFEVQMKLYFVPEANEKAQTLWHALKLHPWGEDAEGKKERGESVTSQSYEEVVFSEPVEGFYDVLTSGGLVSGAGQQGVGRGGGKSAKGGSKGATMGRRGGAEKSAEIPEMSTEGNPYSKQTEDAEVGRMREAVRRVEGLRREEGRKKVEREKTMDALSKEAKAAAAGA